VTEADITAFAGLSGDYNPLHTDEEFAKTTVFGSRVAHGLLVLSMVSGLKARLGLSEGTVMAFLGLEWSFKRPVLPGDTIRAKVITKEKRETSKPDRGIVIQKVQVINQRGEVAQEGEHILMVARHP